MRLLFLMFVTAVCVLFLLKLIFSFGYLRRTLVVLKVLGGFFVSSEAVSDLDGSGHGVAVLSIEDSRGRVVSVPKFSEEFFLKKIIEVSLGNKM